jgi:hypothetical protein
MSTQLEIKDDQITQLNEVIQKQAVHIQSLIQEKSKLNMKLLQETTRIINMVEILVKLYFKHYTSFE